MAGKNTDEHIYLVLEYIEKTYHKDIGDVVFAGRGRKVSERKVYGMMSANLTSAQKREVPIMPLVQKKGGTGLQVGFSCDSDDIIFISDQESMLGWIKNGRVQRVTFNEQEYLPSLRSIQGRTLFRGKERLLKYGTAKSDWFSVGVLPACLANKLQGDSGASDGSLFVFEDQGVFCSVVEGDALRMYSLEEGVESGTLMQPLGSQFLGLIGAKTPLYAAFSLVSGRIQFCEMGERQIVNTLLPCPLSIGPAGTSVVIPICSGSLGLLIVNAHESASNKGDIQIWMISVNGRTSEVRQQVDFSPPSRNIPEF